MTVSSGYVTDLVNEQEVFEEELKEKLNASGEECIKKKRKG